MAEWAKQLDLHSGGWTDAYIAALALASGYRLVAFDADFCRFPGVDFLHLTA